MKHRRRLALLALVLLLLIGSWLCGPRVYWSAIGRYRGDAWYDGNPSSWWVKRVRETEGPWKVRGSRAISGNFPLPPKPSLWEKLYEDWIRPAPGPSPYDLVVGDPNAIPVLLDMFCAEPIARQSADTPWKEYAVSWVAMKGLQIMGLDKQVLEAWNSIGPDAQQLSRAEQLQLMKDYWQKTVEKEPDSENGRDAEALLTELKRR